MNKAPRLAAEFLGTLWLVLGGCGSAVLAAVFFNIGIGLAGIALAFGLSVLTMAYAVGTSPAGTSTRPSRSALPSPGASRDRAAALHCRAGRRRDRRVAHPLSWIATGRAGFEVGRFAANGYDGHSPGQFGLLAGLVCEIVMTFFFVLIVLGTTDERAPPGFAPLAIGLALTVIHLVSIPVTGTSVNPARSTGPALIVGGWALGQLWLFWVAPLLGAVLAGYVHRWLADRA